MSKIEVNTVEPQCGTTLTLGGSGDTVALGSGASQTGFGRTGTVDWITTPKVTGDSPVTGVSGKGYFMNTTAGTITLNLPAGSAGDIISLADYAGTWQTYSVTISPNGTDKIGGSNDNATLNTEGQSVTLVYVDGVQGWVNTMDSTSNVRGESFMSASVSGSCNTLTNSCCGNYKIATFKNPGTFCVSALSGTPANNIVDYVIVGGGGSGPATSGGDGISGGGGGGGFRFYANPSTNPQTGPGAPRNAPAGVTVTASPYPISVGGGGPAGTAPSGWAPGVASTALCLAAAGGGRGGRGDPNGEGQPGGSGGGANNGNGTAGTGNTPPVSPPQGMDGGAAPGVSAGGGGGGALVAGAAAANPAGGVGGDGAGITGFGTTGQSCGGQYYFSGGGGGANGNANAPGGTAGAGGKGGGAPGLTPSSPTPTTSNGIANTGGGGGGASDLTPVGGGGGAGGSGGSGIVIIRYKFQ